MSKKKQLIVMMGGPGVGKGTISQMMMDTHPYRHIEAGAMLRSQPADSQIGKLISVGDLVPDELACNLIAPELTGKDDIILDGFPRTLGQAQWLVKNYADKYQIHVINLFADEEILIARINKRLNSGSTRADDKSIGIIRHRLENFNNITIPAVNWMRNAPNICFYDIDAGTNPDKIYTEIDQRLN